MNILVVSSEIIPFAKTGGLADVAGTLPKYYKKNEHKVIVAMPFYKHIIKANIKKFGIKKDIKIEQTRELTVKQGKNNILFKIHIWIYDGLRYLLYENDDLFDRDSLYTMKSEDKGKSEIREYSDNFERFSAFSKAVLETIFRIQMDFDVIHCHDWQTSMIPIYAKSDKYKSKFERLPLFVLTIHNLAFQGLFPHSKWNLSGLDDSYYHFESMEFWSDMNLLKGGIIYSDLLTTVSPTYCKEIQNKEFGCGLDGFLSHYNNKLYGILNGIDIREWNPETDEYIAPYNYKLNSITNKKTFKLKFLRAGGFANLQFPFFTMVTRLTEQKGIQLLLSIFEKLMSLPLNLYILGSGDPKFEKKLNKFAKRFPKKFKFQTGFNDQLAHQLYGAGDFFLMPSTFEPCGLGQMIAMRYGNIPIVSCTGGLKDTVTDFTKNNSKGTGFIFHRQNSEKLLQTVRTAIDVYKGNNFYKFINNAMKQDFSWDISTKKYLKLFKEGHKK